MEPKLNGVAETLLIPLWARAAETQGPSPIVNDAKAVEMVERIDYDFSKFEDAWLSQVGVAVKTAILDREVAGYINKHPDAVIINLGAGLDTRFFRVNNDKIQWYDLDLPEVIGLRENFFSETRNYRMVASSVFDSSWIKAIPVSSEPILIVAEGLLMYFAKDEVGDLMKKLVAAFPGAEMLLEMMTPTIAKRSKQHDSVSKTRAKFKWGIMHGREMEDFHSAIRFVNEWNYFDYHRNRWRWMGWLAYISAFKSRFNNRIVHLRFLPPEADRNLNKSLFNSRR